jgi:hypothetical protein
MGGETPAALPAGTKENYHGNYWFDAGQAGDTNTQKIHAMHAKLRTTREMGQDKRHEQHSK